MPASVVVVSTPEHRAERLAKLNLKEEHFRNAIIAGENARSICTGNHPALYRGMKAWGEATRTLRDETARSGYVADETAGFATALNRDLGIAIVIAAGDAATGVDRDSLTPKTKYRKGPLTVAAVERNKFQLELFPGLVDVPEDDPINGRTTWFLMTYRDPSSRAIRAELSLPAAMTEDARVTGWIERIILEPIPVDELPTLPASEAPPIDVPVERLPDGTS